MQAAQGLVAELLTLGIDDHSELAARDLIVAYLNWDPAVLGRRDGYAHITGSAFVADLARERVLLNFHGKVGRWIQFGGHASPGDGSVFATAERECREETGLGSLQAHRAGDAARPAIFGVDAHTVREGGPLEEHLHLDLRYLFLADELTPICTTHESREVRWFSLADALDVVEDHNVTRCLEKIARMMVGS